MMKKTILILLMSLVCMVSGARVYVATDKSCYIAGDRIWCSVFSTGGPAVAYLELISTDGPAARTRIDLRHGRGGGSLLIPPETPTGNYRLYAYTGPGDLGHDGPVLSVFNTFSTARVKDGVEIADEMEGSSYVQTGYGLAVSTGGKLLLENTSGSTVSCCISLRREDSLRGTGFSSIAGFEPGAPAPESTGETILAALVGRDASAVAARVADDSTGVYALLAVPGSKTDCYAGSTRSDGLFSFSTENIFGSHDMAFMLGGLMDGEQCHLEPVSPFLTPAAAGIPKLKICRSMEADLLRRSASLMETAPSDTVSVTLPLRREHFFLTHECVSYILDDYTRFPTMEEVFVEITPNVKLRRPGGRPQVYVLMNTSVLDAIPRWGKAIVMIDGVPVLDQKLVETYDPAIVKVVEVYPYKYEMGGKTFDGVVNLATFSGRMPGVLFDDNVRIYDFPGCSWPQEHRGGETLFWSPLVSLGPGQTIEIPAEGMTDSTAYTISAEGLTASGSPVYLTKTFVR